MARAFTQQERHEMLVALIDNRIGLDMLNLIHSMFLFGLPTLTREQQEAAEDHYHSRAYDNLVQLDDAKLYEMWLDLRRRMASPEIVLPESEEGDE